MSCTGRSEMELTSNYMTLLSFLQNELYGTVGDGTNIQLEKKKKKKGNRLTIVESRELN